MPRKRIQVTAAEMQFLTMLWQEGPLKLGQAHERISQYGRRIAYPTVQTHLNRIVDKNLATRSADRPAVYAARVTYEQVSVGRVQELIQSVTSGQVIPLVARLVDEHQLTDQQIDELEALLKQAKTKARSKLRKRSKP